MYALMKRKRKSAKSVCIDDDIDEIQDTLYCLYICTPQNNQITQQYKE